MSDWRDEWRREREEDRAKAKRVFSLAVPFVETRSVMHTGRTDCICGKCVDTRLAGLKHTRYAGKHRG